MQIDTFRPMKYLIAFIVITGLVSGQSIRMSTGSMESTHIHNAAIHQLMVDIVTNHNQSVFFGIQGTQTKKDTRDLPIVSLPVGMRFHLMNGAFQPFVSVGFSINSIPSHFGAAFIGNFYSLGVSTSIGTFNWYLEYAHHVGANTFHTFDYNSIQLGLIVPLGQTQTNRLKKPSPPQFKRSISLPRGTRKAPSKKEQSAIRQAQDAMNTFDWSY